MYRSRTMAWAAVLMLLSACAAPLAEAADRRGASRSGSGSPTVRGGPVARPAPARAPSSARSASPRATVPARVPVAAPGTARGRATYGYGTTYGVYPPYDPLYGWGGWWWGGAYSWGWPYWGFTYWGWPYAGTAVVAPTTTDLERSPVPPGVVETAITPRSATVRLDGEEIGRAKDFNGVWDSLSLPPGVYVFEFSKDGYRTFRAVVDVRSGRRFRVERSLVEGEGLDPRSDPFPEPAAAAPPPSALTHGFLSVRVRPPDAAVYLDGEFLAHGAELDRLHGAIPVAAGRHRLEVVRPGHASRVVDVDVAPGVPAERLSIELEPER